MKLKILNETKISRVWQFVENPKYSFGIMSAHRSDLSRDENEENETELLKNILDNGYGFIELVGGSTEKLDSGEEVDITEPSYLINGITRRKLVNWGVKYNQDSVLYKNKDGFELISTSERNNKKVGDILGQFNFAQGRENIALGIEAVRQYYSRLKKGSHRRKKFSFVFKEKLRPNWMGGMANQAPVWITLIEDK
jgi:hypothetical protein